MMINIYWIVCLFVWIHLTSSYFITATFVAIVRVGVGIDKEMIENQASTSGGIIFPFLLGVLLNMLDYIVYVMTI